ncbi:MAG TPA: decarboxylating 6-phosphogluconate dehydrogenase [Tepiditoga sp.]|nr:decarboxylating 6-phosphogluconate dehydrogenase [Tepiditoga sp.]
MKIAILGLGRMGFNMAQRLIERKHDVIVYNRSREKTDRLVAEGATGAYSLKELQEKNGGENSIYWLMLPAGDPTENTLKELFNLLNPGDIIVEGGNTYYKDDIKRSALFAEKGIKYLDAGVSGGVWGLKNGYCTMIGGEKETFEYIKPILDDLEPENGYMYCGKTGAGHYVKMIHNGIEYGLMEAYAEGFELLKASEYGDINLSEVSGMWNNGSVIRSWLLELLQESFKDDDNLEDFAGYVEDSGEARWTVLESIDKGVAMPVIAESLYKRFQSRQKDIYSNKVVAALRNQFGGHAFYKKDTDIRKSSAGAGKVKAANPQEGDVDASDK